MKNFSAKNAEFETLKINNEAAISSADLGTAPNQIPLNKDLGGLAYQDAVNLDDVSADMLELRAIAAEISDSAVDVFVYDTSRDSDGGAWRKRTQHTSWYNEELNTETRGGRREFPAVAVIVAEAKKVTIYDGDDPDLSMWMVFEEPKYTHPQHRNILYGPGNMNSIYALNGFIMTDSQATGFWSVLISFLKDGCLGIRGDQSTHMIYEGNLAERNVQHDLYWKGPQRDESWWLKGRIISNFVNDVAMTILPNAPIDEDTGLPAPTIAVACGDGADSGFSIINHDGTVANKLYTESSKSQSVSFTSDNRLVVSQKRNNDGDIWVAIYDNLTTSTSTSGVIVHDSNISIKYNDTNHLNLPNVLSGTADTVSNKYIMSNSGLSLLDLDEPYIGSYVDDNPVNIYGMAAYVTSKYNTGWMHGDIKLATLSDTTVETIGAATTELITNGDFSNGTTGWTAQEDNGTFTASNGVATIAYVTGPTSYEQYVTTVIGKTYTLSFDITAISTSQPQFYYNTGSGDVGMAGMDDTGVKTSTFVANSTSTRIWVRCPFEGSFDIDNISVRPAEEDRSVNNNGLQIVGEINKTPVAPGADLVAYSGFSANDYLVQPYNEDLDFGTGDFCVMGWFKSSDISSTGFLIDNSDQDTTTNLNLKARFAVYKESSVLKFYTNNNVVNSEVQSSSLSSNIWYFFTAKRANGNIVLYVNGEQVDSNSDNSINLSNTSSTLAVGVNWNRSGPASSEDICLLRISKTAPTADQIAKIYRDEKVLFTDGAQATLYGTSDAVTALAYDEKTELLHVGTSSGRSDFSGLRRINNTTTAITTSISAHNNLIAEQ